MEAAPGPRQLAAGTMLDDKYRIERLLAVGGMGAVYVGTHVKLRKRVAIKVLNPQLSTPLMIERFHREAITASQIGHEGIAQVTDLGTSGEDEPFLVMEYLEGESLAARLRTTGALPIDVACELGCAILSPLGAAHHAGIVHRDLKPDNVFLVRLSRGEMVKLLDFGISRTTGAEQEFRLTTTGLVLGTPYYMSPEQARGESEITTAADIYAFGVMLYEMLIGQVPIQGENYNQLMYHVLSGEFVPPRQRRADIPEALEQLILLAMAQEPAHRPASAAVLEKALLAFCRPTFRDHTIERISQSRISQKTLQPSFAVATDRTELATPSNPKIELPSQAQRAPEVARDPVSRKSRVGLVVAMFAVVAGGAAATVVLTRAPAASSTTAPASTPVVDPPVARPAEPVATPPLSPPPAAPAKVTLRLDVDPATAVITIDGAKVTDRELVVDKSETPHTLTITAPGFVPHTETIQYAESQRLAITLKPVKRTERPHRQGHKPDPDRIDTQSPYK